MKNFKLKKLLTLMSVTLLTAVVMLPIKASAAWKQDSTGWWNTEGSSYSTNWKAIDNSWYYFGSDGYMKTGWINDGGKWYYTASSGAMQTGWLSNNGAWYYLSTSGDMKTGLVEVNNKTYYLSESGAMKTGNVTFNGVNYTFASNGEKVNSTTANQDAVTKPATTNSTESVTDSSTGSSGGSGGGSSSSGTKNSSSSSYKDLCATWTVKSCIEPAKLSEDNIKDCVGQQFTISENSITATIPSMGTITAKNPTVKESTMTASDFKDKFGIDVDDNTVKRTDISYAGHSADVYSTDKGTYASIKGALFELEK